MMQIVQVFARAPVPGACKTRLIPAIGAEGAAQLQRNLTRHTLATAAAWRASVPGARIELWCAPDQGDDFFAQCAREFPLQLHDQPGGDLGARMWLALMHALRRGERAVLVGTDCPWLDPRALGALHEALAGHDSALIPADDGGYVAVGLSRALPELFAGVAWGSPQVMAQTRARARLARASLAELGSLADVDVPADLQRLRADARLCHLLPAAAKATA